MNARALAIRPKRTKRRKVEAQRAIALLRVSTEKQDLGPEAQRHAIEKYAATQGYVVVSFHEERVSGAADPTLDERPGLWEALDAARDGRATVFLVAKYDRLARDPIVQTLVERHLAAFDCRIEAADGQANGTSPEALLMRSILAAFAQYERAMIRSRTKAAQQATWRRGEHWGGTLPYGYRLGEDGVSLVADEAEGPVLDQILALRAAGSTYQAILNWLQADVPARGERWHMTRVQQICRRGRVV